MESLRKTLDNIRKNRPDVIHKIGNWYYNPESEVYALLSVINGNICFILLNGYLWDSPLEVKDHKHLTQDEWESISGGEWAFVCESQV